MNLIEQYQEMRIVRIKMKGVNGKKDVRDDYEIVEMGSHQENKDRVGTENQTGQQS